ncbi:MAG: phosphotransferase [Lachnospiraceae bacterium]|nr:phosphotransferase [Lachnospiraceae bacterium]
MLNEVVNGKEENGRLIISLSGRIDSSNAPLVETRISELRQEHPADFIELDCDNLEYISSAGLRVMLRLIQQVEKVIFTNVHPELYEVLDLTGFTEMTTVRKACRVISVEGCEVVGEGANGKVYRLDPDTIVKVYRNPDALPEIHRERELARMAFVAGVPTAIPYDVVQIASGGYGSVFELLNAKSFAKLLTGGEKTLEEVAQMSIDLLKIIHGRTIRSGSLPDMKALAQSWADFLTDFLPADQDEKLHALIEAVPEDEHLIHGDFHIKNIMYQNGESLLIDMDTLSHGHPVFELGSIFNAYAGFNLIEPEASLKFMGLSAETCYSFWRRSLELYLGTQDAAVIDSVEEKAKIVGLTRILRRAVRRSDPGSEFGRKAVEICRAELAALLPRVDSLVF